MKKLKEKLKSFITLIACGTGITIFAYAVWFAVKHKGNGNNFLVNFIGFYRKKTTGSLVQWMNCEKYIKNI